jgi:hypothetical protein
MAMCRGVSRRPYSTDARVAFQLMSVVPRVARTCTACAVPSATYIPFYSSGCVAAPMPYCLPAEPWILLIGSMMEVACYSVNEGDSYSRCTIT